MDRGTVKLCSAMVLFCDARWTSLKGGLFAFCLGAAYLSQYCPALCIWIMKKVGPLRAAQLKSGGSGYDIKAMFFGSGRVKAD